MWKIWQKAQYNGIYVIKNFQLYHGEKKINFQWDDDEVHFVLDEHARLDFL
jgi:hypothetical protein